MTKPIQEQVTKQRRFTQYLCGIVGASTLTEKALGLFEKSIQEKIDQATEQERERIDQKIDGIFQSFNHTQYENPILALASKVKLALQENTNEK